MAQTHTPLIGTHNAKCSCGSWRAPSRCGGETQGEYTHRAYEAHEAHKMRNEQQSLLADHQTLFDGGAL